MLQALALAAVFVVSAPPAAEAQEQFRIAAKVNDDAITGNELAARTRFALNSSRVADSPDARQRVQRQVLSQMIDERLQLQDAKRNSVTVTDVEINERISQLEAANGIPPGQFRNAVEQQGLPRGMIEEQIKANLAWIKLVRRRIVPQIEVSDNEVATAMQQLKASVGKQETRVAEIFMSVDRPEMAEEIRRNAERVLGQIRAGASFSAMAQQFSQSATAAVGGDIGWVLPGTLDPAIDRAIEKLQPRQLSDPIRTPAGWHIILVVDRRPVGKAVGPDEIRVHVEQMIIPLPPKPSLEEVEKQKGVAQTAISEAKSCADLRKVAAKIKGTSTNALDSLRAGDMPPHIRDPLVSGPIGTALGPFQVPAGIQVLVICSRQGSDGMPSRDAIVQNLRGQKIEAAARRYMRDLRRNALIDIRL